MTLPFDNSWDVAAQVVTSRHQHQQRVYHLVAQSLVLGPPTATVPEFGVVDAPAQPSTLMVQLTDIWNQLVDMVVDFYWLWKTAGVARDVFNWFADLLSQLAHMIQLRSH
jgi:hypothetical protein